jgi:Zn-dependent protease with chaperone function
MDFGKKVPLSNREKLDKHLIEYMGIGLTAAVGGATCLFVGGPTLLAIVGGLAGFTAIKRADIDVPSIFIRHNYQHLIPKDHTVSKMVERLAKEAGLEKTPDCIFAKEQAFQKIHIPFAGAMGSSNSSAVIVSRNIEKKLTPSELEAVLAHEITHIKHADTKRLSAIHSVSQMGSGAMIYVFAVSAMALLGIGTPLAFSAGLTAVGGMLASASITAAVTRALERRADKGSVELTKNPWALASALGRIVELQMDTMKQLNRPKPGKIVRLFTNLLRTHPKTKARRHQLKKMGRELIEENPQLAQLKQRTAKEIEIFERIQKMKSIANDNQDINNNQNRHNGSGPWMQAMPDILPLSDIKASRPFNRAAAVEQNNHMKEPEYEAHSQKIKGHAREPGR